MVFPSPMGEGASDASHSEGDSSMDAMERQHGLQRSLS
jgi:hypothetical protein